MKKTLSNYRKGKELKVRFAVRLVAIFLLLLIQPGCHGDIGPILQTEGYIVGGYHCLGNTAIPTPYGSGRTYLIETISPEPDTLLVFGVPVDLFDLPDAWMGYYSFPEDQKRNFKIRIRYRNISRPQDDNWYTILCTLDLPNISHHYPNVVVISARRLN